MIRSGTVDFTVRARRFHADRRARRLQRAGCSGGENANCSKLVARGIGNANRAGQLRTAKGEDSMLWAQILCLLTALSVLYGMDIFAMICVCAQRRERELQQVGFAR